jgi:hypothetical protein
MLTTNTFQTPAGAQAPDVADVAPRSAGRRRWILAALFMITAAAIVARLIIALVSVGTNDAFTFVEFANDIRHLGLVQTYAKEVMFNHPPLVGILSTFLLKCVAPVAVPFHAAYPNQISYQFSVLLRLPVIAADAAGAWLLWRIWRDKIGSVRAASIVAIFAWSLDSILVSGFHCNTDPIYVMFCLAAVFLLEEKRAYFWSGLALAAAINVKVIPMLLVPPLLLSCRGRREVRPFILGLAVGAIPFLPLLVQNFPAFYGNVLAYNSLMDHWGLNFFLLWSSARAPVVMLSRPAIAYHFIGRYLIFAAIGAWSVAARIWPRWDRYQLAAVAFSLFLLLTPGFGVQYVVIVGLLLFATRPMLATIYAASSSLFVFIVYWHRLMPGVWPLRALFQQPLSFGESLAGLMTWGVIAYYVASTVLLGARRPQRERQLPPGPDNLGAMARAGQASLSSYTSARAA